MYFEEVVTCISVYHIPKAGLIQKKHLYRSLNYMYASESTSRVCLYSDFLVPKYYTVAVVAVYTSMYDSRRQELAKFVLSYKMLIFSSTCVIFMKI